MDCGHLHALSQWFDGELEGEAKAGFERHMAGCGICRRARGELLALRDGLRAADPGVDREVQRRTLERILSSRRPPLWRRRMAVPVPLLAAGALVIVALAGLALQPARPAVPAGDGPGEAAPRAEAVPAPGPAGGPDLPAERDSGTTIDLARFDRGGRAVLYKIPRPAGGEVAR